MQAPGRAPGGLAYLLFLPLFFASGVAALVYQIVWQRLLTFFSGADVFSVTLIVAAFMPGLGCGSLAGGHLADRLSPRGRVLAFAAAEVGTALFALASVPLVHGFFFVRLGPLALPLPVTALVLFAVLLVPTFLMGLTLPLLSRVVTTMPRPGGPQDRGALRLEHARGGAGRLRDGLVGRARARLRRHRARGGRAQPQLKWRRGLLITIPRAP